jgi:hypothetical protein
MACSQVSHPEMRLVSAAVCASFSHLRTLKENYEIIKICLVQMCILCFFQKTVLGGWEEGGDLCLRNEWHQQTHNAAIGSQPTTLYCC